MWEYQTVFPTNIDIEDSEVSFKAAEVDTDVIDGTIKTIETGSQSLSGVVRSLTTGSARDYILMVAVGMMVIFVLVWGVA